jgi:energy-converting hydrogenase B subunit Q
LELEGVSETEKLIDEIRDVSDVISVKTYRPFDQIYGKRVIVIGGGAQVSQVVLGAVTEADRHNIRGERISVDTIPLVGEEKLAEAVRAVGRLHRASILVLAGSIMGGEVVEAVKELKREHGIAVIGVMAVMTVSDTAKFDIKKAKNKIF